MRFDSARQVQLIAIVLLLVAGWLWSQRLAEDSYRRALIDIQNAESDQISTVQMLVDKRDDPFDLIDMGRQFLESGNGRYAVLPLEKAVELKPEFRDAWYWLGYAYLQAAQEIANPEAGALRTEYSDKGVAALKEAYRIDPGYEPTLELLRQLGEI